MSGADQASDQQSQFELGRTLLSENRPLEALEAFQRLLQASPKDQQGELGLAETYRELGNNDQARQVLERASQEHPKSAAPLTSLAELELASQNFAAALADAKLAARVEPTNRVTRLDLATAREALGDSNGALRELTLVLRGDLQSSDIVFIGAHYLRAQIYSGQNQDSEALADLERVISAAPDNLRGRVLLAQVALRLNQCGKVIDALEPVVARHENDAESLYMLSRAYRCAGKQDLADQTLTEYKQRSLDEHSQHTRQYDAAQLTEQAGALARSNHLDAALDLIGQALAKDPENGDALILRAEVYYSQAKFGEAHESAEGALKRNPYDPEYLYVMGTILERQSDLKGALHCLEDATQVNPQDAQALYEMGGVYLKLNDRRTARQAFKKAVELDPRNPEYRKALIASNGKD